MSRSERLKMPMGKKAQDEEMDMAMDDIGSEDAVSDMEIPEEGMEESAMSPLADSETEDLIAEMELRGYNVSPIEGEADAMPMEESAEDEMI